MPSRCATGSSPRGLLTGSAGIGKTTIAIRLQAMAASRRLFPAGKSDQCRRDVPYATIAQALQQLARQVLGKSDAVVERWREALRAALGENARLAVDLVRDLELVIGAQPRSPSCRRRTHGRGSRPSSVACSACSRARSLYPGAHRPRGAARFAPDRRTHRPTWRSTRITMPTR